MQASKLYKVDLESGEASVVQKQVGPGGNINAMGFNALDNYLYAFVSIGDKMQQLIRIDADGGSSLLPLTVPSGLNVGDFDDKGQFWVSRRGSSWAQVDLKPGSGTFGQLVANGTSPGDIVGDWAYLANGGDYMYSIRTGKTAQAARWSTKTHVWENLEDFGQPTGDTSGYGALYAVGDELWGSNNQSGEIIAFPVLSKGGQARRISDGPKTSSNDGARCYSASEQH